MNLYFYHFCPFPPIPKIKHLTELASAVEKGDFHCVSNFRTGIVKNLWDTKQKHLRVIARDINRNNRRATNVMSDFLFGNTTENVALFVESRILEYFTEEYFVSEDCIFPELGAMAVRKGFCCKQLLDAFIHRMKASGILNKHESDGIFYHKVQNTNSTLEK